MIRGMPTVIEASRGLIVLKVPNGRGNRGLGDVHPLGSPFQHRRGSNAHFKRD
jgi:hypothetical protein